ncbi:MAG: sulfur carrier protein ThiS [Asticcacaulis sp.]
MQEITVNGEIRSVSALTLQALVEELGLNARKVAVERNLLIVPRSLYEQTPIMTGDRIEIVQFVGGG